MYGRAHIGSGGTKSFCQPAPTICGCHGRYQQRRYTAAHSFSDKQGIRFKHIFKPEQSGSPEAWRSWPAEQFEEPNDHVHVQQQDERINPRSLWPARSSPHSFKVNNPYAQKFRVTPAPVPVPVSLPGTEYWYVEALNDYSKEWPSIRITQGHVQLRAGFLKYVDDPKSVPFFFYKGLEQVRYTWGDRAFQMLYTAAYASKYWGSHKESAEPIGVGGIQQQLA